MSDGVESQNLRRVMRRNMNPENYDPPTFDEVMREKEDTITALRAENARLAQWTDNAQERFFQSVKEVDAVRAAHEALLRRTQSLETALDQERADNERLREYAQHTGAWCGQNMGHACTCGLDALLSGGGEGGNDG